MQARSTSFATVLAALVLVAPPAPAQDWIQGGNARDVELYALRHGASEFDSVSIFIEWNVTTDDAEIGIEAEPATDLGLERFTVLGPSLHRVLHLTASRRFEGLQNMADLEGPSLPGLEILDVFPEGSYFFFAIATDGEKFFGTAELSHELTIPTAFVSPTDGEVVSPAGFTIEWTPVLGAEKYLLEIENDTDDLGHLVELSGDVTSFEVPASLLVPGAEYQSSVNAIGENKNIVQVEVAYSIAN